MSSSTRRVVIFGGGVSGLSAAYRLLADPELYNQTPTHPADRARAATLETMRTNLEVVLIEPSLEAGGNIRTQEEDGFRVEWGPNGFLDNAPETPRLARQLGLESHLLPANDNAAKRYIFARGRLRPVPMAPPAFLFSDILTLNGRMRVLAEPFVPARPDPTESVYSFASRRIGPEAARVLVDSMVSGVYAGDSHAMELGSCFMKLHTLERDHGSLIRGMIASGREARAKAREAAARGEAPKKAGGPAGPGGVLTSFDRGMHVLTGTLLATVREKGCVLRIGQSITTLEHLPSDPHWRVTLSNGDRFEADAVLLATPPAVAADLLAPIDPAIALPLRAIPPSPIVVVALAFGNEQLPSPLNGFGFLVARSDSRADRAKEPRCLGVLWDSSIYSGRAPQGQVLMRAMIGGARDPGVIELDDDRLLTQIAADLRVSMGLTATPRRTWIFRHPRGIPQYTLGHAARLAEIDRRAAALPGLFLTGNGYRGISVNHCVEQSIGVARRVLGALPLRVEPTIAT